MTLSGGWRLAPQDTKTIPINTTELWTAAKSRTATATTQATFFTFRFIKRVIPQWRQSNPMARGQLTGQRNLLKVTDARETERTMISAKYRTHMGIKDRNFGKFTLMQR